LPAVGVVVSAAFLATTAAQRGPTPNLTKPVSVEKASDANGFIPRWLVLARFLDAEDQPVKGFTVKLGDVAR
jgi:hypothetical protein